MPALSMQQEPQDDAPPALTRWSYEYFETIYNGIFWGKGKNGLAKGEPDSRRIDKEEDTKDKSNNDTVQSLAPYERFRLQSNGEFRERNGANGTSIENRVKNMLPPFESVEMRTLAESISSDIIQGSLDVSWDSVKGLENAKKLLKEAVVMPIKYPQYFTGLLAPWKGILLFGPPGTGKTMLAKAVATECKTTFFNISASSIVSKWRGDSEKLVRVLFQLARHHAPSTIFIDEIDSIISKRGEGRSEHEASRRLKTELLIQMDGLMQTKDLVFVLAATNLPWELDGAMLRRLEKRILVPLPDPEARYAMFKSLLPQQEHIDLPFDLMVDGTKGFSGSDIRLVCKEAAMRPLRRLMNELESRDELCTEELPSMGPIIEEDVRTALKSTRPSAHMDEHRYIDFNEKFGCQSAF